jgi:phthiocerol/phenolphthiocerol synthesis type-I polyketide synthase E
MTGPCQLLLLSAATRPDLVQLSEQIAEFLATQPESSFADIAYTLQTDDHTGAQRLALVSDSIADARHLLSSGDPSRVVAATLEPGARLPLLLMFPGIGDQYAGMAQELYGADATFRETLDLCLEMLGAQLGHDVKRLFHSAATPELGPGPTVGGFSSQPDPFRSLRPSGKRPCPRSSALDLSSTLYAQPLVFAVEYALGKTLITWGIEPAAMIGYSLGEYVAACLAGVFSLEDALAIVARRASLIDGLPRGAMLAVPLSEEEVAPLLEPETSLAALNGAAQSVVSGPPEAIQRLADRLHAGGVATLPLATSHAFHSPSLLPIAEPFARLMRGVQLRAPVIPYISNVTGGWITPQQARSVQYWTEHLVSPVRFADGVHSLLDRHPDGCLFLEVGPGQSLGSLVAQIGCDEGRPPVVLPTLPHAHDRQGDTSLLLRTLGRLWVAGVEIDWSRLHGPIRRRLDLPLALLRQAPRAERPALRQWWSRGAHVRPRTDAERLVAGLWHEVLRRGQVGTCDSFFELGGDSFAAARLLALLGDRCGAKMTLRDFFAAPTVAEQARAIERQLTAHVEGRVEHEPAAEDGPGPPPPARAQAVYLHRLSDGTEIYCQSGTEAEFLYQDIFARRVYCQHGIALLPGACVLDVGANIGLFSLFAHLECRGDLTLHAFEPAPALREIYRLNAQLHAASFKLHDYGLAEASRAATLAFYPRSSGMSTFYPSQQEEREALRALLSNESRQTGSALAELRDREEDWLDLRFEQEDLECRLLPLREVMRIEGIEHIDLLKVDVQKSELDVLLGIAAADWKRIDQIVLEVHDADGRLATVTELLRGRGFLVTTAQDEVFTGTTQYNVYARQPGAQ